jgi:uncharacterized protein YjdB
VGDVTFTCSNTRFATIDQDGNVCNVFGKRPGKVTITATTATQQAELAIAVKYTFVQWLLVIFCFGWLWLPVK